jgi:hypothetical protein
MDWDTDPKDQGAEGEGWFTDPYGRHEARWLSNGRATKLVRDGVVESYDEPPTDLPTLNAQPVETIPPRENKTFLPLRFRLLLAILFLLGGIGFFILFRTTVRSVAEGSIAVALFIVGGGAFILAYIRRDRFYSYKGREPSSEGWDSPHH